MAVITISRQHYSEGHDICKRLAELTGYTLYDKETMFRKIVELGCPEKVVKSFEDIRPNFLFSLSKFNDEYIYYLKTAVYSIAEEGNCIIEGRGAYHILKGISNHVSARIVDNKENRIQRAMQEHGVNEKKAGRLVRKSDKEQFGYLTYYFKTTGLTPAEFNLIINSGISDVNSGANAIKGFTEAFVNEERESEGKKVLSELLIGQRIVNMLRFIYFINIDYMRAEVKDKVITLYGISSTKGIVDNALDILKYELSDYEIHSRIRVVQGGLNEISYEMKSGNGKV